MSMQDEQLPDILWAPYQSQTQYNKHIHHTADKQNLWSVNPAFTSSLEHQFAEASFAAEKCSELPLNSPVCYHTSYWKQQKGR